MKTTWRTLLTKMPKNLGLVNDITISWIPGWASKKFKEKGIVVSPEELLDYEITVSESETASWYTISITHKDITLSHNFGREAFRFTKEEYLTI